jgi:hypothetical protein
MSATKVMQMICATAEAIGGQITPAAAALMANDLNAFTIDKIGLALAEVRRTARGRLVVGDILRVLSAADGRPARDEAWAIGLSSADEDETVVMTDEIQLAMAACRPVLDAGDKVGARMAFMSAYDRFIDEARRAGDPVNWRVSLGYNASRRDAALAQAVQLKRLPQEKANLFLSHEIAQKPTRDGQAIAGLITGKVVAPESEKVRSHLQQIRESLEAGKKTAEQQRAMDAQQKIDDHNERLRKHEELLRKAMESDK